MNKLLTALFLFLFSTLTFAQSQVDWKYDSYPELPFLLNHIQLDINIETESSLIKGVGTYKLTSRQPDLAQIIFNTSDLDVKEISSEGNAIDFEVSNDSLIISLSDTVGIGDEIQFLITWESNSPYGIHKDTYGNIWTSLNPKARHHWIPIPDHPEVIATLDASFSIPADQQVVFNGTFVDDEVISAEQKKVNWTSETTIPVSGLTFAVGPFTSESARAGVKQVSVYASENAVMEEVKSGLLSIAVESVKAYEEKFSFEFPYDALNVVVLPDNRWEEIQSGAGVIYLYQNLGSLSTQLRRGVAEQWLGNYHRYLDAPNHKFEFLKALVTGNSDTQQLLNPDDLESIRFWNSWQAGIGNIENEFQSNTIQESLPELMQEFEGVTGWNDYADFWYDKSGAFWSEFSIPATLNTGGEERYSYDVNYLYDEMNNSLSFVFEAQGNPIEALAGVEVMQFGFMDTTRSEISFTGDRDSVSVDITSGVDYVTLNPVSDFDIELNEKKPFLFLIRQLRSSDAELQIRAAKQLQNFTENPDLQLALQDVLNTVSEPEVRAALLETLSMITQGASGTEQNFLEQLNSDNLATKLSAIRALTNYPGNDQVTFSIRNTLIRAESDTVFEVALKTYQELAETEDILSVTERLEQSLEGQQRAIKLLQITAQSDTTNRSISIADRFALGSFPHQIRKQALEILLENEQNQDYWAQTLPMLLEDRDARIRYQALDAVQFLSAKQTVDLIKDALNEEMDPRVIAKIRRIM